MVSLPVQCDSGSVLEGVRIGPKGPLMEELRKDSLEMAARAWTVRPFPFNGRG